MSSTVKQRVSLARALHLAERASHGPPRKPRPEARERAERRLERWRDQTPFDREEWLAQRCALDGLDIEGLTALLAESDDELAERFAGETPWAERLQAVYAEASTGRVEPSDSPPGSAARPSPERTAFAAIAEPLLASARRALADRVRETRRGFPDAPFGGEVTAQLYRGLPGRVDWLLSRSVVVEMRVAKLLDELPGDDPRDRFHRFVSSLAEPSRALAFLGEYPVLARLLVEALDRWVETSAELLERLAADWPEIVERLAEGRNPGPLAEVSPALGDTHRNGRAVRSLRFASGLRLMYKPRSLAVDVRFAELTAWLHERGAVELRTPRVLARTDGSGDYGWCEFVAPEPCPSRPAAERFYERQGALLALLYCLNANDFHRSNLIAAGEHPVPVDLESLLGADYGQNDPEAFDLSAEHELRDSVWRVMLLPYLRRHADGGVVDMSGLGGQAGQLALRDAPTWTNRETDEMRLEWRRPELSAKANVPTLGSERLDALSFGDQIAEGFAAMYRLLERHREELAAPGSPLARLAACELRVIFRASQLYSMLLGESEHPDRLRDALDRDRLFDRLWFGMERTRFPALAQSLIPSERDALWRADLPLFTARGDSHDVRDDMGRLLPGLLRRSGLEMVRRRLDKLGDEDLRFQLWIIESSLTALAPDGDAGYRRYAPPSEVPPTGPDDRLAEALRIGDRLAEVARIEESDDGGRASWLGLSRAADGRCEIRALDHDLYSGLPGIALFFAHLAEIGGRIRDRVLAEQTWRSASVLLDRWPPERLGAFDGWGGALYTAHHLARLWCTDEPLGALPGWLEAISELANGDEQLDLVRGAAGCIPPLLALADDPQLIGESAAAAALALARRLGDRLVATAEPAEVSQTGEPAGVWWNVAASRGRPLLGFSHGVSGPASALLDLHAATGEERYLATALDGLRCESAHYDAERRNWPDLRIGPLTDGGKKPAFLAAWCHGATGIGIARLRMLRHLEAAGDSEWAQTWKERAERDLDAACATTLRLGLGTNHSLCHGDLGALDLLQQAAAHRSGGIGSDAGAAPSWRQETDEAADRVLASIAEHGWICGVPTAVETSGLMNGLAGIGYGLLRLAVPERVPSVLALDPPTASDPIPNPADRSTNPDQESR